MNWFSFFVEEVIFRDIDDEDWYDDEGGNKGNHRDCCQPGEQCSICLYPAENLLYITHDGSLSFSCCSYNISNSGMNKPATNIDPQQGVLVILFQHDTGVQRMIQAFQIYL